jgi:hypothetical protein
MVLFFQRLIRYSRLKAKKAPFYVASMGEEDTKSTKMSSQEAEINASF